MFSGSIKRDQWHEMDYVAAPSMSILLRNLDQVLQGLCGLQLMYLQKHRSNPAKH